MNKFTNKIMIKIYLYDKKKNLKPELHQSLVYLTGTFLEIRKEAVKIYDWLKAVERRQVDFLTHKLNGKQLEIEIIDKVKNKKKVAVFLESFLLLNYKFEKYKKNKKSNFKIKYPKNKFFQKEIIDGVFFARDLVNEPLSYLTAPQLSKELKTASQNSCFQLEVYSQKEIESLGMGGVLSVNKGSVNPPTFNIMTHMPNKKQKKTNCFSREGGSL